MSKLLVLCVVLLGSHAAAQCEVQTLSASDGASSDTLGNSVSIWEDRALITGIYDDGIGFDSGSAYIFERQGSTWVQVVKLLASDEAEEDRFGHSSSIHGDQAIVGARYNQDAGYGSGSAYVFERQAGVWSETAYLVAPVQQTNAFFGQSCDIENDVAVVGASIEDGPGGVNQGAVHVFEKQLGTWTLTQTLLASDATPNARFGEALAMDGSTLVVGARGESAVGAQAGAAYVFESVGGVWTETRKLIAGDPQAAAIFGTHVAINGDVIVIGAMLEDSLGVDTGAVYVFERTAGVWAQTAKFLPDTTVSTLFGAVAVWGDAILVGASTDSDKASSAGAAYRYKKINGFWRRTGKFTSDAAEESDAFGTAVALWETDALISAKAAKNPSGVKTGEAYIYNRLNDIIPYGAGTAGTGGLTPSLSLRGCPAPTGFVYVEVADAAPNSLAVMLFGLNQASWPLVGCTLLMYPLLPLEFTLPLDGTGTMKFSGQIPPAIPSQVTIQMQTFVVDPGGPQGFSSTAAVSLTIDR
jgi:hypothetical protein